MTLYTAAILVALVAASMPMFRLELDHAIELLAG